MKRLSNAVLLVLFACASAAAAPLNVVNVGAPAVNCVFNKSCSGAGRASYSHARSRECLPRPLRDSTVTSTA
jgi:hypothetical protein